PEAVVHRGVPGAGRGVLGGRGELGPVLQPRGQDRLPLLVGDARGGQVRVVDEYGRTRRIRLLGYGRYGRTRLVGLGEYDGVRHAGLSRCCDEFRDVFRDGPGHGAAGVPVPGAAAPWRTYFLFLRRSAVFSMRSTRRCRSLRSTLSPARPRFPMRAIRAAIRAFSPSVKSRKLRSSAMGQASVVSGVAAAMAA